MQQMQQQVNNAQAMQGQLQRLHDVGLLKHSEEGLMEAVGSFEEHQEILRVKEEDRISAATIKQQMAQQPIYVPSEGRRRAGNMLEEVDQSFQQMSSRILRSEFNEDSLSDDQIWRVQE